MNKLTISWLVASMSLSLGGGVFAGEFDVSQKDKQFSVAELTITTGDTVKFVNQDPFFHNIFSLSDLKSFDLGSFPQGEHRVVEFDRTGRVEVECAIHPSMRMVIHVE